MLKNVGFIAAASLFVWNFCTQSSTHTAEVTQIVLNEEAPEALYKQYCASCHGEKVEMFVDRSWKYGNAKPQLIKSITQGSLDNGMPAWGEVLSAQEIDALAGLIVEKLATVSQYQFNNKPQTAIFESSAGTLRMDTLATGLTSPWGIEQLPDRSLLVTDRSGMLYHVSTNGQKKEVSGVPEVVAEGQGGLLDITLHPQFEKNNWVYLSYSKGKMEGGQKLATTAIYRAKWSNGQLVEGQDIFVGEPWSRTRYHFGSRIVFDKKGYLFFTMGDRGNQQDNPQNLSSDAGKVHRIHEDGKIPVDNPFLKTKGARPTIYSYGHRNPQGLVYLAERDELWAHEHGPRGGDEINIVKKGHNYGWPVISYGINYDGKAFTNLTAKEGMDQPVIYWIPSIAPSGMTFVTSDKYPTWKGDLFSGSLRFKYLNRSVMSGQKVKEEIKELPNVGRMREVFQGRDGYLYLGLEEPGLVVRVNSGK